MPVLPAPSAPTHSMHGASFTSLATPSRGSTDTAVWRVDLAPGTPATPHQLTRQEVLVVLAGTASVLIGGEAATASVGDAIVVPVATSFELRNGGPDTLSVIACLPVGGQAQMGDAEPFTPPWAQ
jgi:mannose-6-phosphate isomerase-like protein (cupin superfamily)